ncbi:breast cancer type 2 susceptibility protein-like [Coccinella septempunctata]|uniref:breast cancer type 2 susceptibility protein-like n=1 Tax=Coccinella septempunctata TaxID=41139 RepID=UPI001D07C210|nr:breast cancer type 2 susceptibility protein-like [Coccinella septempunctata]
MDTEKNSCDTPETAGSPVLGSSTFKKKIFKKNTNRKSAKIRLSEKFENDIPTSDVPLLNENFYLNNELPVNEELTVNNKLDIGNGESKPNILSHKIPNSMGFQTASGKPVLSKAESSDFANALMGELVNPLIVTKRENKYRFLSKCSTRPKCQSESSKSDVGNFLGFGDDELRYSMKMKRNLQYLINALISKRLNSSIAKTDDKGDIQRTLQFPNFSKQNQNDEAQSYSINNGSSDFSKNMFVRAKETDEKDEKLEQLDIESSKILCISQQQSEHKEKKLLISSKNESLLFDLKTMKKPFKSNEDSISNINENSIEEQSGVAGSLCSDIGNQLKKSKEKQKVQPFTIESGCKINIYPSSLKQKAIFEDFGDVDINTNTIDRQCVPEKIMDDLYSEQQTSTILKSEIPKNVGIGFSTASGKKIEISSNKLLKIQSVFENITDLRISDFISKSCDQGNEKQIKNMENHRSNYNMSPNPVLKTVNKFDNPKNVCHGNVAKGTMKLLVDNKADINAIPQKKCAEEISSLFSTASGKNIKLPNSSLLGIDKIFKDIPDFDTIKSETTENICAIKDQDSGKVNPCNTFATFSPLKINKTQNMPSAEINGSYCTPSKKNLNIRLAEEKSNSVSHSKITETDNNINYTTPQKNIPSKKRLGGSASKDKKISDVALKRAKMLFGDINFDDLKLPPHLKFGSPNTSEASFSTPLRPNKIKTPQYSSTPNRIVKKNESFINDFPHESNHPFIIQKPTPRNLEDLNEELSRQKKILEKKLDFITKKQEAIRNQILAQTSEKRFKLDPQEKNNKINLRDVKNLESQSEFMENQNCVIQQINPQNSSLIHFNNNWYELPTVTTADGCTLIPNSQGFIGISEIEPAFTSMNGIEKKLIPDGWIKNHYRWIVWKLASYERVFPATLGGCFNIDNVIKQLKYRYLREIYNAERPALRKIYEMDDVPQKRIILCISNVIKNGDDIELELTDGWYCIRAIIDDLLCYQINMQRIKIGSKLIITGAELMNCSGCHPLEVDQARKVRLKIHFNSTRRAAWYSKLGYQKDPSPLSIKLSSAVWNGGTIGRITVYIMRIYPVIYREKRTNSVLWRNKNAEYKKIQEFENECLKKYEEGDNVNIIRRNVCSLLQMTVIDFFTEQPKPFKCTIWDATDSHQEQLKENQIVSFYNLTMRCNEELSCNKKSYFEVRKCPTEKYEKYRRKYVELASYPIMSINASFGEFDTVGFIVKKNIEENGQHFWLTDLKNNFLLVKINEGPNNCLLLNKVEENCLVAVCNLKLKDNNETYVIATGSLQTIITQFPQYDFLRVKMEEMGQHNKDEMFLTLENNRKLIENFENGNQHEQPSHSSTTGENDLNFSRVTSTDAAMSMINIDEIVNNHTK